MIDDLCMVSPLLSLEPPNDGSSDSSADDRSGERSRGDGRSGSKSASHHFVRECCVMLIGEKVNVGVDFISGDILRWPSERWRVATCRGRNQNYQITQSPQRRR